MTGNPDNNGRGRLQKVFEDASNKKKIAVFLNLIVFDLVSYYLLVKLVSIGNFVFIIIR